MQLRSEYGSEGVRVQLSGLSEYGSVAHLFKDQYGKHIPDSSRTPSYPVSALFAPWSCRPSNMVVAGSKVQHLILVAAL